VVREVLRYPDPRLKTPAAPVGRIGPAARRLAEDLRDTARAHPRTVGLAAPQVGAPWRMVWVDCTGHPRVPEPLGPMWLVDPRVVEREGSEVGREGCLSVPEITARVRRAGRVAVRARDLDGHERLLRAEGFEARVLQHEIDHLDGVLILDRVASLLLDVFPRRGEAGLAGSVRRAPAGAIGQSPPP
jgi:peptide deformylase